MASEGVDAIARAEALLDALRRDQSVRLLAIEAGEGIDRVASQAQLLVATSQEIGDLPADVHAEPLGDGATIPFPIDDLYAGWRTALAEATVAIEQLAQDPAGAVSGQPPGAPHVGRLSTGIDRLHSLLQLRWVAGQEAREVAETFSRAATSALEAHEELQIQVELLDERPPHDGGERDATWTHRAGEVLTSLGRDGAPREGALSTDAGRLALHGLSALTFGPGDPRTLYGPQESVSLEELEETLEFYVAMIASWCT